MRRASERAGRPPIRQRKSSWKNPWETDGRERKERESERASERGGSGRYSSYVACRATRGGGGERMAALIVIRVWRAKRTNFMSQRTEPHPSLPPSLLSRSLRYDYRGGAPLSYRLTNQSGEITASRVEGERVIEDVAYSGWRLRGLKAFCKRDIPDDRRGGEGGYEGRRRGENEKLVHITRVGQSRKPYKL